MKKFVWMMAGVMVATSLLAQPAPTPTEPPAAPLTTPPPAPATNAPAAKKAAPKKAAAKKTAPKKETAPAAPAAPAVPEKPIVLVPGPGTMTGDNVNVRGRASFVGEIVKRLNKGDAVTVIEQVIRENPKPGEPSQWAKISYPKGANVWVHHTYVSNGVVVPKRLNVRAGPGENYSVVGLVERGAAAKEISRKNNWVEIEAPADAYAFVAAKFVKQDGTPPEVPPIVSIPSEAAITNVVQGPATINTNVVDNTAGPVPVLPPDDPTLPPPPPEPPPPRIVSHEGVVRPTVSIQAPTRFEIWEPSTRMSINYLHTTSTNLSLERYNGRRIIVTGEEALDRRWKNTPVITIQKIQVVENAR